MARGLRTPTPPDGPMPSRVVVENVEVPMLSLGNDRWQGGFAIGDIATHDNPHTKAFRFWEWLIAEVRRERPETIFLAEAFTRPKVMYQLLALLHPRHVPAQVFRLRRKVRTEHDFDYFL